jgi:hypothetical protein
MSWFDSLAKAVSSAVEIGTRDLQEFVGTVTEDTSVATQAATQVAASALTAAASAASAAAAVAAAEAERLTSMVDHDHQDQFSEPTSSGIVPILKDNTSSEKITTIPADISIPEKAADLNETSVTPTPLTPSPSVAPLLTPSKALSAAEIVKERLKKIEAAEEEPLGWGDDELPEERVEGKGK